MCTMRKEQWTSMQSIKTAFFVCVFCASKRRWGPSSKKTTYSTSTGPKHTSSPYILCSSCKKRTGASQCKIHKQTSRSPMAISKSTRPNRRMRFISQHIESFIIIIIKYGSCLFFISSMHHCGSTRIVARVCVIVSNHRQQSPRQHDDVVNTDGKM